MMCPLAKVSLIIPLYNAEATIGDCLASVAGLSYPKDRIEVIVVDNGSTDRSVEIADEAGVIVLRETKRSSYAARNRGTERAGGDIIAFTDADCVLTSDWLENLLKGAGEKRYGCFAGEILSFQPETFAEIIADWAGMISQKHAIECSYLPYAQTANAAYLRDVFDKVGLFNPDLTSGGDADMSWRMQRSTDYMIKYNPEAIVYHKHRTTIMGLYRQLERHEYGKIFLKKYHPDLSAREGCDYRKRQPIPVNGTSAAATKPGSLTIGEKGLNGLLSLFFHGIKTCARISAIMKSGS